MNDTPNQRPAFVRVNSGGQELVTIHYGHRTTRNAWRSVYRLLRLMVDRQQARAVMVGLMWSQPKITTQPEPKRYRFEVVR